MTNIICTSRLVIDVVLNLSIFFIDLFWWGRREILTSILNLYSILRSNSRRSSCLWILKQKRESSVNKNFENETIRKKIKKGELKKDPDSVVDFFIRKKDEENYFDITSAKPNIKEFVVLKRKLLRWTALRLSQDRNVKVVTRLAIPYNPYHPQPYERWTLKGLYDLSKGEILVGEEFWNFVANDNIYKELLNVFQDTGKILRKEIDRKFTGLREK